MKQYRNEQNGPHGPQQRRIRVQGFGVMVDDLSPQKNLKVSQHVGDEIPEQDYPGQRHDSLLTNRGIVKPRRAVDGCRGTHNTVSFLNDRRGLWREMRGQTKVIDYVSNRRAPNR